VHYSTVQYSATLHSITVINSQFLPVYPYPSHSVVLGQEKMEMEMRQPIQRKLSIGEDHKNESHNYFRQLQGTSVCEGDAEFRREAAKKAEDITSSSPRGARVVDVLVKEKGLEWELQLDSAHQKPPQERKLSSPRHHVHHEVNSSPRQRRVSEKAAGSTHPITV